jgi:Fic family protein
MLRVHELLQRRPIIGILPASRELNVTHPTITKALDHLQKLEIVREVTATATRQVILLRPLHEYLDTRYRSDPDAVK